jgi:hypothetical protein
MSPHCEQRGLAYTHRGGALAATRQFYHRVSVSNVRLFVEYCIFFRLKFHFIVDLS